MDVAGLKAISENSGTLTSWCISILGGSLAAFLSTSILKPLSGTFRWMFLLFVPGWIFLTISIWSGNMVIRKCIMPLLNERLLTPEQIGEISLVYEHQLNYFFYAIVCFSLWLTTYLVWWFTATGKSELSNNK